MGSDSVGSAVEVLWDGLRWAAGGCCVVIGPCTGVKRADSPKREERDGERDADGVGLVEVCAAGVGGKSEVLRTGLGEVKFRPARRRLFGLGERDVSASF